MINDYLLLIKGKTYGYNYSHFIGLTTYGAINKEAMAPDMKKTLLFTALVASQIPDSDALVQLTEKGRVMYQMWYRGLSHSIFMAPLWAGLIYLAGYLIWKRKDKMIFCLALLNVLLHVGTDSLNTWGTGLFEPFSSARVTLGVIPIVDIVINNKTTRLESYLVVLLLLRLFLIYKLIIFF